MALIEPFLPPGSINRCSQPVVAAGPYVLRPWVPQDAAAVLAAHQDPAIARWHRRSMEQIQEAEQLIRKWRGLWDAETGAAWAVSDLGGTVVGRVAVNRINLFEGDGEIGYWVMPESRGKGVAPLAVAAARDWAFHLAGLKRLQLSHSVHNEASCRIAEKTSFALEGVKRSALRHEDGWHDMHLHAAFNRN